MEQRIDMLERDIGAIKSELAIIKTTYWMREDGRILDSRLSRLELDVAQLKNDVAQLRSDMGQVKSDISVLQLALAKAEADLAEMKSDVYRCFDEIQKINERLTKMEVRFIGMDERQDARDRRRTEIFERIEARIASLASKDDALQAEVYRLKTWVVTTAIAIVTANAAMLMLVL